MLSRKISGAIALLLFFVVVGKTVESQRPLPHISCYHSSASETPDTTGIELYIRSVQKHSDSWEIELETRNNSQRAVFVLTDPIRADGKTGPYLELSEADRTVLKISVRFHDGPNHYLLYSNATGVKLTRLEPQTSHLEKYTLPFPLRSTVPPYGESLAQAEERIDVAKIKSVKASVGILPDDEGIRDLLRRKPFGPFSNGSEQILKGALKGKALMDIQTIISSSYTI